MIKTRKILLEVLPYSACLLAGLFLFIVGTKADENLRGLILNIAAAFFAIPFLFLIYDLTQKFSQKKLNKELFDYAKMRVDREILSIINQLTKIVQPYERQDFSFRGIATFLSQNKEQIKELLEKSDYLGFQVFKNWSISEKNICSILESPFILRRLENEQSISIITLLKEVRSFEAVQKNVTDLYEVTNKRVDGFKIQGGKEISERNTEYPDRYLLLKHLTEDKYLVADFGDFAPYQMEKLLNVCKLNKKYSEAYSTSIFDIIKQINRWLNLTGSEFLIDTKMFRIGVRYPGRQAT